MKSFISIFLLLSTFASLAQVRFEYDFSIPVTQNGQVLKRAFEGGLNSAQFQSMDLNGDNVSDLVVFHRISRSISTYINESDQWVLKPEYSFQFPEDVANWMVLKDFDCDGLKDLFTSTTLGIKVYKNISSGSTLSWQVASEFLTQDSGSNIQVSATDIPGFADVNGDGALDILTYRFGSSSSIDYYEGNGSCGDLTFTRVTRSWGNLYDCGCSDFSFGQPCPNAGGIANTIDQPSEPNLIQHIGGKTILPYDADGDGDIDIITSDELCDNLVFLRNEGTVAEAAMTSFESIPVSDPVSFQFFPSAFMEDIDFDGIDELIVSTNIDQNAGNLVDFQSQIKVFENIGDNTIPNFEGESPFLQNEMVDLGEDAFPTFYDFDNDGDQDLFVGNTGSLLNGDFIGTVWQFENVGNRFNPQFELLTTDFANLSSLGYTYLKPQFADLDQDDQIDLILQAKVGQLDTRVFFLKGNNAFEFSAEQDLELETTDSSNPLVIDLDRNGLPDVLIGNQFGSLTAFFNQGGSSFIAEEDFGGFENDFTRQNLSLAIGKFSLNAGDKLITIDSKGSLRLYDDQADENFRVTNFEENLLAFEETLISTNFGRASYLAAVDLYGDGIMSLLIGSSKGGFYFLRNKTEANPSGDTELRVLLAPNPSRSIVRILTNSDAIAKIIDLSGRIIEEGIVLENSVTKELNFSTLPPAVYLVRISSSNGQTVTKRILIQP